MASTVDILRGGPGQPSFMFLKLTGIPAVFFCGIDPTDPRYGSAAWDLGDGVLAVRGMSEPGPITQALSDVIGGVASPERLKVSLTDFKAYDAGGEYLYLSRLFSPGVATSTPGRYFELAADIPASAGTGDTVLVRASVRPDDGFYTIGGETLEIEGWTGPTLGYSEGTIVAGRNRFPCSDIYPAIPYHRVVKNADGSGAIGQTILITKVDSPFKRIGRTAAFYVGHMDGGVPCAEADAMLRLIGRVASIDYGQAGAKSATYEVEIESVTSGLLNTLVAPGLGTARIVDDQIVIPDSNANNVRWQWNTFRLVIGQTAAPTYHTVDIVLDTSGQPNANYTLSELIAVTNAALAASNPTPWLPVVFGLIDVEGQPHVQVQAVFGPGGVNFDLYHLEAGQWSLLSALGFESDEFGIKVNLDQIIEDSQGRPVSVRAVAQKPAPNVFIPVTSEHLADPVRFKVQGADGSTSQFFFEDQGDGSAYVEFDDGSVVLLTDVDTTDGLHLTTGHRWRYPPSIPGEVVTIPPFYYVPRGRRGTLRQIVIAGDRSDNVDAGLLLGRFLASHDEQSALDDLNYYPEGVGLGLNRALDAESVLAITSYGSSYPREVVVDSDTKLGDLLTPILKEYGLCVVWDPATERISFRPLRLPSAAGAHDVVLSVSNKTKTSDRTSKRTDQTNLRTSWKLSWGWNRDTQEFTGNSNTLVDNYAQSTGVLGKPDEIEDKTLVATGDLDAFTLIAEFIFSRSFLYREELDKCGRTMNRVGLTIAPGSYHPIVDDTAINPFTGVPGITADDGVYGLLTSVTGDFRPSQGGKVEYLVSATVKATLLRKLSPSGLVDYLATGHGWDGATGILTMGKRYSNHPTQKDGRNFIVGDKVRLIQRDGGALFAPLSDPPGGIWTVSAVAADGSTMTVDTSAAVVPDNMELLVVLADYSNSTAARKASVAYQGDRISQLIQSVPGAQNHRWA